MQVSKRKKIVYAVVGTSLMAGTAVGGHAAVSHAEGSKIRTGTVMTKSDPLSVRSGPSTDEARVGSLKKGAKVKITCRTKGQWVKGTRSTTNWWDKIGPGKYVSHAYIKTNRWIPVCKGSGSTNGSLPKAPRNNPHPSAMSKAPNLTERAAHVRKEMAKAFPGIQCDVSAYRPGQKSDHNSGNAIDCFPGRFGVFPKGATKKEGDQAAAWLRKYAGKLDVQYVIWQNKIWNKKPGLNEKGWREHRHAGQVTLGHYDHLHISVTAPVQY